jgi:hypothetical protein
MAENTENSIKEWTYSISTETIWTSFDYGTVKAKNYDEALEKAKEQLRYDFKKANEILASCDPTKGFTIEYDESQIEIKEIVQPNKL